MTPASATPPTDPGASPSGSHDDPGQSTITIVCNGDGSYSVSQDDGDEPDAAPTPGAAPDTEQPPVQVQSVADVLHVVKQMLSASGDPKAAWNAEAQGRDATGMPAPQAPAMTM